MYKNSWGHWTIVIKSWLWRFYDDKQWQQLTTDDGCFCKTGLDDDYSDDKLVTMMIVVMVTIRWWWFWCWWRSAAAADDDDDDDDDDGGALWTLLWYPVIIVSCELLSICSQSYSPTPTCCIIIFPFVSYLSCSIKPFQATNLNICWTFQNNKQKKQKHQQTCNQAAGMWVLSSYGSRKLELTWQSYQTGSTERCCEPKLLKSIAAWCFSRWWVKHVYFHSDPWEDDPVWLYIIYFF